MRRWAVFAGLLVVLSALVLLYLWQENPVVEPSSDAVTEPDLSPAKASAGESAPVSVSDSPAPVVEPGLRWELEPGDVVEDVKSPRLLRHYGAEDRSGADDVWLVGAVLQRFWNMFKDPDLLVVGSNEDIVASLAGANPEGIAFISPDNGFLDDSGRLLDRWGSPLFFHVESMTRIEIRSSGPDGDRFTEDDFVFVATTPVRLK